MKNAIATSFFGVTFASSGVFDYKKNGSDWGSNTEECAYGKFQSPIDLTVAGATKNTKMQLDGMGYLNYANATLQVSSDTVKIAVGGNDGIL